MVGASFMFHYLKILRISYSISLMSIIIYRMNFALMLIQNIINAVVTILSTDFLFSYIDEIAGWSRNEVVILVCTAQVINALYRGIVRPNLGILSSGIRTGVLDFILLKPVNFIFMVTLGKFDLSSLFAIIVPIYFIIKNVKDMNLSISFLNILGYLIFVMLGLLLITAIMTIIFSLSFIFVDVSKLEELYYTFMTIFEKPKNIFNKFFAFSFFYIIPLIPIANAPVMLLLNKSHISFYFKVTAIVPLFILLAILFIKYGIKRYESASS